MSSLPKTARMEWDPCECGQQRNVEGGEQTQCIWSQYTSLKTYFQSHYSKMKNYIYFQEWVQNGGKLLFYFSCTLANFLFFFFFPIWIVSIFPKFTLMQSLPGRLTWILYSNLLLVVVNTLSVTCIEVSSAPKCRLPGKNIHSFSVAYASWSNIKHICVGKSRNN